MIHLDETPDPDRIDAATLPPVQQPQPVLHLPARLGHPHPLLPRLSEDRRDALPPAVPVRRGVGRVRMDARRHVVKFMSQRETGVSDSH